MVDVLHLVLWIFKIFGCDFVWIFKIFVLQILWIGWVFVLRILLWGSRDGSWWRRDEEGDDECDEERDGYEEVVVEEGDSDEEVVVEEAHAHSEKGKKVAYMSEDVFTKFFLIAQPHKP